MENINAPMGHPHSDKRHVVRQTRRYLLAAKYSYGTARSLVHYRDLLRTYLTAKQSLIKENKDNGKD